MKSEKFLAQTKNAKNLFCPSILQNNNWTLMLLMRCPVSIHSIARTRIKGKHIRTFLNSHKEGPSAEISIEFFTKFHTIRCLG